jgi:hypothetical protein
MTQKFFLKYALSHYNDIDVSDNKSFVQLNNDEKTKIFFIRHISIDKEKERFSVTYLDVDDRETVRQCMLDWINDGGRLVDFVYPTATLIIDRGDVRRISISKIDNE